MAVTYVPFDRERVSREWSIVLHDLRDDGVAFRINEGHRTWRRQAYFYALWRSGRGNLAARPSRNAPHIRTGRIDHAIDFQHADRVVRGLRRKGIRASTPVPGEPWHVEASAEQLRRYAANRHDPVIKPPYLLRRRRNSKAAVLRLQKLLRSLNMQVPQNGRYDRKTRVAVRRFQQKHGLKVDGIVGPGTWKAIRKATG